jgi:TM2 domain-containing membrane protein YozV/RNA polymerase subunit RPABC4/transcription elongation factor Spt4
MFMFCRNCGYPIDSTFSQCPRCGSLKGSGNAFCSACGHSASPEGGACPNCGYTESAAPAPKGKSRVVAGVLGILLGWLGIHNFYLGYVGKGMLQLMITIVSLGTLGFISAIWGLVEGIMLLSGSIVTDAHDKLLL